METFLPLPTDLFTCGQSAWTTSLILRKAHGTRFRVPHWEVFLSLFHVWRAPSVTSKNAKNALSNFIRPGCKFHTVPSKTQTTPAINCGHFFAAENKWSLLQRLIVLQNTNNKISNHPSTCKDRFVSRHLNIFFPVHYYNFVQRFFIAHRHNVFPYSRPVSRTCLSILWEEIPNFEIFSKKWHVSVHKCYAAQICRGSGKFWRSTRPCGRWLANYRLPTWPIF